MSFNSRPRLVSWLVGALLLGGLALNTTSCDDVDCGDGTILEKGQCVALYPVNCTEGGVSYENGFCRIDPAGICGPGTQLSDDGMQCIGTANVADVGGGDDDMGMGDMADMVVIPTYEPHCAADLVDGDLQCLWGRVVDFVDGTGVPEDADPLLEVQVFDLFDLLNTASASADAVLGRAEVEEHGFFTVESFEPASLNLVVAGEVESEIGEESDGTTYQRCITELFQTGAGTILEERVFYILKKSDVEAWNTTLGVDLMTSGFMIVRVVEQTGAGATTPIEGATLSHTSMTGATPIIRYFADEELTTFQPEGATTTGPSGVVLLYETGQLDNCNVAADGFISVGSFTCGTNPDRASVGTAPMVAE